MSFKVILLFIPFFVLVNTFFTTKFDFWENRTDCEYAYLFNGLNFANNYGDIGHFDHPGTTTQVVNALVIKFKYFIRDANNTLQIDVLKHPESYLKSIAWFYTFLSCLFIFLFSYYIYSISKSLISALIIQSCVLFSQSSIVNGFFRVSPEPMLFVLSIIFCYLLMKFYYEKKKMGSFTLQFNSEVLPKTILKFDLQSIVFGLFIGFCLSTKLNTIPFFIVPLFYFSRKQIAVYCFFVFFGFLLFTLPIIRHYDYFFNWIYSLGSHTGKYGEGESKVFDFNLMSDNFLRLISHEFILVIVFLISIFFIWYSRDLKYEFKRIFLSILSAQLLLILLIIKHFGFHYLTPIYPLLSFNLFLIYDSKIFDKKIAHVFISLIFFLCLFNFRRPEVKRSQPIITSNSVNIYAFGSSSPLFALKFGDDFSNHVNSDKLKDLYGPVFFYNSYTKKYYNWKSEISIDSLLKLEKKVYVYGLDEIIDKLEVSGLKKGMYLKK